MASPTSPPRKSSLHLPLPRPAFQREYTATPSHSRLYTPKAHHGFIALHTSTPEHTLDNHEHQSRPSTADYFFVQKNSPILSPDQTPYEAHGFLPLCSVAAVGDYPNDYFSVSLNQDTDTMEASFEGFDSPAPSTAEECDTASESTARFPGYINTSHLSLSELAHPTGSPIHERDIVTSPGSMQDLRNENASVMRGGGGEYFYEKEQESSKDNHEKEGIQSQEATSTTENSSQDVNKPIRPPKTGEHGVATEPTRERANELGSFPSLDPEIEALLSRIAAAFPNASVKISPSAHDSESDENNTSTRNNDSYSGVTTNESLLKDNSCQSEPYQRASLGDSLVENQIIEPLPDVDLDTMVHDKSMDNPELGKILPLPLSPRPSTPASRKPKKKKKKKQPHKPLSPINTNSGGLFDIVRRSTAKEIASCRSGMKIDIVNADTGEVYVRNVSLHMLWHFCGINAMERFAPGDNDRVDILKIPAEEAEKGGIARVIRYMRRACTGAIVRPTGELRIPTFVAGIETIRACRILSLEADAARIEKLILHTWMESEEWYMTDEHVELIWDGYHGLLRETALGDAIVWFVLNEVQTGTHPLAEEIRWMLDQEEYESLKERVQSENVGIRKAWRHESRKQYLERCRVEREEKQRNEEERIGVRPRQEEPHCLYYDSEQTKTSHRGQERYRRGSTRSLGEDATESEVPAPTASQTSSRRRRSINSRAGADTPRPVSLAESDSWTGIPPKIAVASLDPSKEPPGLGSRSESDDSARIRLEEVPAPPKQKLSLLRRLEERIDRR